MRPGIKHPVAGCQWHSLGGAGASSEDEAYPTRDIGAPANPTLDRSSPRRRRWFCRRGFRSHHFASVHSSLLTPLFEGAGSLGPSRVSVPFLRVGCFVAVGQGVRKSAPGPTVLTVGFAFGRRYCHGDLTPTGVVLVKGQIPTRATDDPIDEPQSDPASVS
jgi:hypothetical protein